MLEIKNLSKKYKNATRYSVKNLSFTLQDGEIFGFLGKNGAGKSTTIKCITGIIPFEEGSITICGHDISRDPINAKLNIGYVPDNHAVYDNLTGREYVTYMGNIYRVEKKVIEERIKKFGAKFNMAFALDNQIRSYSHGMKQKICIMAALIHNPKFWVLDEPLMGLDPQSSYEIKQYMLEHKKLGNTVFFSSHNLEIVEKICDRVAIINKGRLIEIIDVKKFMEESDVSLEEYFLNKTNTEPPKEDEVQPKKSKEKGKAKKSKKADKNLVTAVEQEQKEVEQENAVEEKVAQEKVEEKTTEVEVEEKENKEDIQKNIEEKQEKTQKKTKKTQKKTK